MNSIIKRQEDGTIELTITLPMEAITKTRNEVIDEHVKEATLPGFRKGMAPRDMVEKSLDTDHIREDILRKLISSSYIEALKENNITPIINPKIHVEKLEEGKDWQFTAITAEKPKVSLGTYKENIKKITASSKIVVPGKEPTPVNFEDISKELLASSEVNIPKVIIDQEVDRLLSQTLDEVKKLGMTLDQYLSSTGRNTETLRSEYEKKAQNDIKLEFVLMEIADTEGIAVTDVEINEAINQAKTDGEKQNLENNKYLLSSIIRQQKTLDFLRNL